MIPCSSSFWCVCWPEVVVMLVWLFHFLLKCSLFACFWDAVVVVLVANCSYKHSLNYIVLQALNCNWLCVCDTASVSQIGNTSFDRAVPGLIDAAFDPSWTWHQGYVRELHWLFEHRSRDNGGHDRNWHFASMRKGLATSQRQWEQQICHDKKSCLRSRCRRAICLNSRKICSILMFFFFARSYFVFCSNFQKVWTNSWGLRSLRHAWLRSHMETWRRRQIISVTPSNLWWSPWERPGIGCLMNASMGIDTAKCLKCSLYIVQVTSTYLYLLSFPHMFTKSIIWLFRFDARVWKRRVTTFMSGKCTVFFVHYLRIILDIKC